MTTSFALPRNGKCRVRASSRPGVLELIELCGVVLSILSCAGCPNRAAATNGADASAAKCTHFGQTCEFAPGKLGSCVQRDNCTEEPCLVCQSQH